MWCVGTMGVSCWLVLVFSLLLTSLLAFQSDELLVDDEEFGIEGGHTRPSDTAYAQSSPPVATTTNRKRFSDSASDSKIQFFLEHAFGDSDFVHAGNFSARLKIWNHGGQVNFLTFLSPLPIKDPSLLYCYLLYSVFLLLNLNAI